MKLNKKNLEELLKNWNLGKVLHFKKTEKGVANHNWIIKTNQGKYILRAVCFKSKKDIDFELKYLNYLKKNFSYEIPNPIINNKNTFYVKYKKAYFWVYNFIEGNDLGFFGKNELRQVARMMTEYHNLLEKSNLDNKKKFQPFMKRTILNELEAFRSQILKKSRMKPEDKIFLKESEILIPILKNLDKKSYSKLKSYPIHRDLNPENILFQNKKLKGIIDFDNVSVGKEPLIKDIAIVFQYSFENKKDKFDFNLAKYFLKEYGKYHKLSDKEVKLILDINMAAFIEDFSFAYWQFLYDKPRAKLSRLREFSQRAQWYYHNKKRIIAKLSE